MRVFALLHRPFRSYVFFFSVHSRSFSFIRHFCAAAATAVAAMLIFFFFFALLSPVSLLGVRQAMKMLL